MVRACVGNMVSAKGVSMVTAQSSQKGRDFDDHGMMVLGLMRPKCKSPGCTKQPVKGGVCIAHGAKRVCMIVGCNRGQFKGKKC